MESAVPENNVRLDADGKLPSIGIDAARFNRNMLIFLIGFEVFLVLIDATINYSKWIDIGAVRRLSNIAREDGLGTWFMATQTLFASLMLFLIYLLHRSAGSRKRIAIGWLVLALFFVVMAADDASQIHERLGSAFEAAVGTDEGAPSTGLGRMLDAFPSYPWQLLLMPIFAVMGLFMFNFLWEQLGDNRARIKLVVALTFFVTAVMLDFIEGMEADNTFNIYTYLKGHTALSDDFVNHFAKSLEEFLEMLAMTLLLSIFFLHISRITSAFEVRFKDSVAGE